MKGYVALMRRAAHEGVDRELEYQDAKWGTPEEHPHDIPGWILIMRGELEEAERAWLKEGDDNALREILQVIAVGFACLEQHGVVERQAP